MPFTLASPGTGNGGTNSAARAVLASAAFAAGASEAVSPLPPPHEINNAASGSQPKTRPVRANRSIVRAPAAPCSGGVHVSEGKHMLRDANAAATPATAGVLFQT